MNSKVWQYLSLSVGLIELCAGLTMWAVNEPQSQEQEQIQESYSNSLEALDDKNTLLEDQLKQAKAAGQSDQETAIQSQINQAQQEKNSLEAGLKAYNARVAEFNANSSTKSQINTIAQNSANEVLIPRKLQSAAGAKSLSTAEIYYITTTDPQQTLNALTPESFAALSPEAKDALVDNLSASALESFVNKYPASAFYSLGGEFMEALHPNQLSAVAKAADSYIGGLTAQQLENITPDHLSTLSQIANLIEEGQVALPSDVLTEFDESLGVAAQADENTPNESSVDEDLKKLETELDKALAAQRMIAAATILPPLADTVVKSVDTYLTEAKASKSAVDQISSAVSSGTMTQAQGIKSLNEQLTKAEAAEDTATQAIQSYLDKILEIKGDNEASTSRVNTAIDSMLSSIESDSLELFKTTLSIFEGYKKSSDESQNTSFFNSIKSTISSIFSYLISSFVTKPKIFDTTKPLSESEITQLRNQTNKLIEDFTKLEAELRINALTTSPQQSAKILNQIAQNIESNLSGLTNYLSWRANSTEPVSEQDLSIGKQLANISEIYEGLKTPSV